MQSSCLSSIAPQGNWLHRWVVFVIRIVLSRRRENDAVHPFTLVWVVENLLPGRRTATPDAVTAVVGVVSIRRNCGWRYYVVLLLHGFRGLMWPRRSRVCDVFQLFFCFFFFFFIAAVGRGGCRGKELAVTEGTSHASSSWRDSGCLDFVPGVATGRSARDSRVMVGEIGLRIGTSNAHHGCVVSVRRFFSRSEWTQPNTRSRDWVSDLRHPFSPSPHAYASVLARRLRASPISLVRLPPGHHVDQFWSTIKY